LWRDLLLKTSIRMLSELFFIRTLPDCLEYGNESNGLYLVFVRKCVQDTFFTEHGCSIDILSKHVPESMSMEKKRGRSG
jgi:hypothetical protein